MNPAELAARLGKARREGREWRCRCPAHADHDPSLSITEHDGKLLVRCRAGCEQEAVIAALRQRGLWSKPVNEPPRIVATYAYRDEYGALRYQVVRLNPKRFFQRRPNGSASTFINNMEGVIPLPYRLPELLGDPDATVFIPEGEKDCDNLGELGLVATCNHGGAGKWRNELSRWLAGRHVVLLPDNDEPGRSHADDVAHKLAGIASSVRVIELPGLPAKGDVSDWIVAGGTPSDLEALVGVTEEFRTKCISAGPPINEAAEAAVSLDDFYAYMPMHNYIYMPSREPWPASSVNARIRPVAIVGASGQPVLDEEGKPKAIPASLWLDRNKPVEQMSWAPGEPAVIDNKLVLHGGWKEHEGAHCLNLYLPPACKLGDPDRAQRWVEHVQNVFAGDTEHIINWLAQRVQRPQVKINHALVLGGKMGIGKDTVLEPVKIAVGPWNFREIFPQHLIGRFNGFVKSVILRIGEARDLGDVNRYQFYDHSKTYTAAPPDVILCDEKNLREHSVFNCCGVIITTNHKTDGIYLPEDDRRHYVAWSDRVKADFSDAYWDELYDWYDHGGIEHVCALLAAVDISRFNPKAPPPRTQAFWEIVDASRAPEDAELQDALDQLKNPEVVTLSRVALYATESFKEWLLDRKNSRRIPHRFEACGYVAVRNDNAKSGLWVIEGKRQVIYAKDSLTPSDRLYAAMRAVGDRQ
jgi:hypothetical protein